MDRHSFDLLSFAFGLIYLLIGLLFLIPATAFDLVPFITASARWVLPTVVLGLGAAIVIPALRRTPEDTTDQD